MNIRPGIRKLAQLFVVFFIAISGGLVYWQVVAAQAVTANVHNGRRCLTNSAPVRGRIFDRNGVLLAESKAEPGVCGYLRHYYDPSLAGLIGYYISPLYNSTGIEHQFDDYLSGRMGVTQIDNTVNNLLHRPPVGDDIYLTIDERIQRVAAEHFNDHIPIDNVNTFASDRGSVIVTDPHTGEILAMVSSPGFDPNKLVSSVAHGDLSYYTQLTKDPHQPMLERPIQATYAPGSTYKALTLMAGLDADKTTLDQPFDRTQALGPVVYNGQKIGPVGNNIQDYTFRFPVTTDYGFTHSDNIIFAQIGVNTGFDTWMDYNKRLYVGSEIPFDLPATVSHVLKEGQTTLENNELAANAFGQGYDAVTPLQMSLIDNVAANDGQLMRPMLISKIMDTNKAPIKVYNPENLGSPISSQTAQEVRKAMFGVVRCGSGSIVQQLFTSDASIIGKTGTAQVSNDGSIPAHAWMITQAPYSITNTGQLPALTIVAMKENGGDGGDAVGPMIAAMYHDIFANNYVKAQLPPPPPTNYCCSAQLLQLGCPG
ncbi:penicillin-binding protein [Ktedonosporobacter rubrisoli]|uniref:Penicillin-binding protein n=1 Tax=Ktedonosporobacter rubrisoli TaxID=2509675 RepID=A0A4P6K0E4_KTERU|nr:penicillin-binding transpeptidase domain-containing protein [Ktedonosporobacter rubrisoli]QBD81263.1 penicillin-binding protein [Ktedonosporobacter rubrisoli]